MTTTNEGWVDDDLNDVVDDAVHWRYVQYSGEISLVDISEDNRHYYLTASFTKGFLDDIWLSQYSHTVANEVPEEYRDIEITPRER